VLSVEEPTDDEDNATDEKETKEEMI
jgi:hypothetical protein